MERVLLTDGVAAVLQETDKTVYEDASSANIIGAGNTIDFLGSAASTASIYCTGGEADKVNGSGGYIELYDAQAQVFGGSDTIDFVGTTGNAVSLFATAGHSTQSRRRRDRLPRWVAGQRVRQRRHGAFRERLYRRTGQLARRAGRLGRRRRIEWRRHSR